MIGYSGRMEKVDRPKKSTKSYRRGGGGDSAKNWCHWSKILLYGQ